LLNSVPDLLTIEEAARVLRIGRTKAYAMSQEWRVTNGASGIKVCEVGGQLRVPKAWLEDQVDAPLLCIPAAERKSDSPPAARAPEPEVAPDAAPARKRRRMNSNQLSLPFD